MSDIISWPRQDVEDVIARARRRLEEGRLVVVPTEATYEIVASALSPAAVESLAAMAPGQRLTILLGHAIEIFDWLPYVPSRGLRLARAFWPGPLTLAGNAGLEQGLSARLPVSVQEATVKEGRIALRLPDHPAPRLLALQGFPLVSLSTPWTTAQEAGERAAADVLLLDDGPTRLQGPPTLVRLHDRTSSVEHEGRLSRAEVEERVPCQILFLCTGNTCRSPLAAGLCARMLADRLGCAIEDLPGRGFRVQSAGLAAMMGEEASAEAVDVGGELGADLSGHRSQPLTMELLTEADVVFAMTSGHMRTLAGVRGIRPRLLCPQGEDIMDPIGSSIDVYRACARQIKLCLEQRLFELHEA